MALLPGNAALPSGSSSPTDANVETCLPAGRLAFPGRPARSTVRANAAYDSVEAGIPRLDPKSNRDHLSAMVEGLRLFVQLAELESTSFDAD